MAANSDTNWTHDITQPTVAVTTDPTSPSTTRAAVSFEMDFSEDVTNFDVNDLKIDVGAGLVAAVGTVDDHGDGDASTYDYDLSAGELADISDNEIIQLRIVAGAGFTDIAGNEMAANSDTNWTHDITAPTVTTVNTAKADGSYKAGEVIDITVSYDEAVTVVITGGVPTLALNSGGSADYNSGSGSTTLTFRYTVTAGETSADLDYSATNSLATNGGTMKDTAGNDADNTLPAVGTFAVAHAIVIDTTAPTTTSAKFTSSITLVFDEPVITTVADYSDVTLSVSGGFVSVSTVSNSGTDIILLDLSGPVAPDETGFVDIAATLTDQAGNPFAAATIAVGDGQSPAFSGILPTASTTIDSITTASDISFTVSEELSAGTITFTRTGGDPDDSAPHTCTLVGTALNAGAHNNFDVSDGVNSCSAEPILVDNAIYSIAFAGADLAGNAATTVTVIDVTFLSPNNPPDAVDDSDNTREGSAKVIKVTANDDDPDGDNLTVTSVVSPTTKGGTAVNNGDGSVTYTPPAGTTPVGDPDTFQYTISDGSLTDNATVSVDVIAPVNVSPLADCTEQDNGTPEGNDKDFVCGEWEVTGDIRIDNFFNKAGVEFILETPYTFDCGGNCDNDTPDVFLEIDWMPNHMPPESLRTNLVASFAAQGIRLHVEYSEEIGVHLDQIEWQGASPLDPQGFAAIKQNFFGNPTERDDLVNPDDYLLGKRQIFHYALFAHDLSGSLFGSSGRADTIGNDIVITLGQFDNEVGSDDQKEGTIMHELGHNLGFYHGGIADFDIDGDGDVDGDDEDANNCKPNYFSVMNYLFQTADQVPGRPLDYSQSDIADLNEDAGLDENKGVLESTPINLQTAYGPSPTTKFALAGDAIDWNRDGDSTNIGVSANINQFANISHCNPSDPDNPTKFFNTLQGYDDWFNINYNLREFGSFATGIIQNDGEIAELTGEDVRNIRLSHADSITDEIEDLSDELFVGDADESEAILDQKINEIRNLIAQGDFETALDKIDELFTLLDTLIVDGQEKDEIIALLGIMQQVLKQALSAPTHNPEDQVFDFGLSAAPVSITIIAGDSVSYSVGAALHNGQPKTVTLSVSDAPAGATATLASTSVIPSGTTTLDVITDGTIPIGTHELTITGTAGDLTKSITVKLIVEVNSPPIADANGPYLTAIVTLVNLDASASSDPNDNIDTFEWDLDNNGLFNDATGPTPSVTFSQTGIFTIAVKVTDTAGVFDIAESSVVVYDPEGGFVTGGGWIDSPLGAYEADPGLTGKATFGFVSKYKKGANIPTGVTEFQFKVADLNFHSDSYEWLVVAGAKAMYKGVGTINGAGNFGFMISAIDEKLTPSTDTDLFRIKIVDKDTDTLVYDNQVDETDDNADPTTAISGGSIIVHKEK